MKNKFILFGVILIICMSTDIAPNYPSKYFPVLMERSELESSVFYRNAQEIEIPGKIYYKNNTIYLIEKYQGVHVIDNTTPSTPNIVGFINIPGCIDIAIKNNILYADNAVDLVAIDISNLTSLKVTERIKNTFPEVTPPDLVYIPSKFNIENRPANTIIIEWKSIEE